MKKKLLQNSDDEDFNPFSYPPKIIQAQKHAKSVLVGVHHDNPTISQQLCPCCENYIEKVPLSILCSAEDLLFLGIGYSLYLTLFKYIFALICLVTLVSGSFIQIIQIFKCGNEDNCIRIFIFPIQKQGEAYAKYNPSLLHYLQITILSAIVGGIYYCMLKYIQIIKQKTTTISEFSVMLLDLPKGITKNQLYEQAQQQFQEKIQMITFCYGTNDIQAALKQKQRLIILLNTQKIKKKAQKEGDKFEQSQQITALQRRINQIKIQIENQDRMINNLVERLNTKQCNTVFITFQSTKPVDKIYQQQQSNCITKIMYYLFPNFETSITIKEKNVNVRVAPHPREVIWENIGNITKTYLLRSVLFIFLMLVAIFVAYYIQFQIVDYLYKLKKQKDLQITSACILVVIVILANNILRYMIKYLLKLKSFCSYSHYQATFCFYYSIVYLFNTCFLVYTIHEQSNQNEEHLFLYEVYLLMVVNAFSQSLYTLLNPLMWIKIIMKKYVLSLPQENNPYPQGYMNKLMEGPQISNTDNYHFFIKLAFVCVWFCNLSPTGLLIALLGLVTYYQVSKYFLLRINMQPQYISQELTILVLKFLIGLPLFYCLGLLKYNHEVKTSQNLFSFFSNFLHFQIVYFSLALAVINYIVFSIFRYNLLLKHKVHTQLSYLEEENKFEETYQSENPLSKLGGQFFIIPNFLQHNSFSSPARLKNSQELKQMTKFNKRTSESPQKKQYKDYQRKVQTLNAKQLRAKLIRKSTFQIVDFLQSLKIKNRKKAKLNKEPSLQLQSQ